VHARDAEDDFDASLLENVDDGIAAGVLIHGWVPLLVLGATVARAARPEHPWV
jgi:hypothetical protein